MINTYTCEHCGETYLEKDLAQKHEQVCDYNKKNRTCCTCSRWYWDPSSGPLDCNGVEEGEGKCKVGLEPHQRNCVRYTL
jgi:hypothetical protein